MATAVQTRLAEALAALSLATDMAAGQPKETALGATILSTRIARSIGLSEERVADTFYASIVRFLGCTSASTEAAALGLGDDQALYFALSMADWTDAANLRQTAEKWIAPNAPPAERDRAVRMLVDMMEDLPAIEPIHCGQAKFLCSRLPVPAGVMQLLSHMYPLWDGTVTGLEGNNTPLEARIILLAVYAENYRRAGGQAAAIEFINSRAGSLFDPSLCLLFEKEYGSLLGGFSAPTLWQLFLDHEPGRTRILDVEGMKSIARTFGDVVDQKSGWSLGHSPQVAALAFSAGKICGLPAEECEQLRLAALMHDIGRMAISNAILDNPEPLSPVELCQFQSHTYHTEQILRLIPNFDGISRLASSAHERADGSGFHRGINVSEDPPSLLAAAHAYAELIRDRPWRNAYTAGAAADKLLKDAAAGKIARRAVNAVLEAAGHGKRKSEQALPAGLTRREVEVLALIVQGRTTRAIADRLAISPKTADHHIQNIYNKTEARGRAAVSLFALQNGIFAK